MYLLQLPGEPSNIVALGGGKAEMTTSSGAIYYTKNAGMNWSAQVCAPLLWYLLEEINLLIALFVLLGAVVARAWRSRGACLMVALRCSTTFGLHTGQLTCRFPLANKFLTLRFVVIIAMASSYDR